MASRVAAIVTLPALGLGFFADDYLHLMTIEGASHIATPFDLFTFGRGDPEGTLESMKNGPYPWFMYPEFKAHFFRPLSSALMLLDHTLFGRFAPAYHVHSTLWHILLALGAMLILRRNFTPALGVLALFLFVLDDSHAFPVVWWSNRNAVVAVSLGFLGVAAHQRWREDAWKPGLPLSLLAFTGGLLAAEIGLSTMAYVLAYELFGARAGQRAGVSFACCRPRCWLSAILFSTGSGTMARQTRTSTWTPAKTRLPTCWLRRCALSSWRARNSLPCPASLRCCTRHSRNLLLRLACWRLR